MTPSQVFDLPADRMDAAVVAAFFFEDQRPVLGPAALLDWRLNGLLTNMLTVQQVSGSVGEHVLVPNNGKLSASRVLFVGGGRWAELDKKAYRRLIRHLIDTCRQAGFSQMALCLEPIEGMDLTELNLIVVQQVEALKDEDIECRLSFTGPN